MRDGVALELVEVVDGVARLVDHVRPRDAQLVRLPEQLDELLEPPALALGALEGGGHLAELGEHGAARGLGRMRGEDRAHGEPVQLGEQLVLVDPRVEDALHRLTEPGSPRAPFGRELAPAVHLLGDVGELEPGREGANQLDRGDRVHPAQQRARLVAILADEQPHPLHELEKVAALLAHEGLAEERPELADVLPQLGLGVGARRGVDRHRRFKLRCPPRAAPRDSHRLPRSARAGRRGGAGSGAREAARAAARGHGHGLRAARQRRRGRAGAGRDRRARALAPRSRERGPTGAGASSAACGRSARGAATCCVRVRPAERSRTA